MNSTWDGERSAVDYSAECSAYPQGFVANYSEDCLYLNIWRPAGLDEKAPLPVAVWIHGGGFTQGSTGNPRFNMSFMVEHSVAMGQPIIGISINYRLNAFGFLSSKEVSKTGHSNFGLRDQRLALHWIQENIAAFGGDPKKVTIFGESAGAISVGLHLTAYNGRDDGLFRYAVMQSGNPIYHTNDSDTEGNQKRFDKLAATAGCGTAKEPLECLRVLPYDDLDALFLNTTLGLMQWVPQMDGDIFARHTSEQIADGSFVKVPIIVGANSEEGTSFGTKGLNTTEDFRSFLVQKKGYPQDFADQVVEIYSQDAPDQVLDHLPLNTVFPAKYGDAWRRVSTYFGDATFVAHRRMTCEAWASRGLKAYCYRFNAVPANMGEERPWMGATHFMDVAFVFLNLDGYGYNDYNPPQLVFDGLSESYKDLARLMNGDWIAFVHSGDPNSWKGRRSVAKTVGLKVPRWPAYKVGKGRCGEIAPRVYVYEGNATSFVEEDTYRQAGIDLINSRNVDVFGR